MQDRESPGGDIRGPTRGDTSADPPGRAGSTGFTDWDNPEDEIEDAPEDYYDDEADEEYELTPDDPDYDLSEAAGYSGREDRGRRPLIPMWLLVALSLLLIFSLLLPALLRFN
jgi:hypothetical protein